MTSRRGTPVVANPDDVGNVWVLVFWGILIFICLSMASAQWNYSIRSLDDLTLTTRLATIEEGNIYRRVGLLVLGAFGLIAVWWRGRPRVVTRGPLPWACAVFIALSYASVLWGEDPRLVVKKLFVFTILAGGAFLVAHAFSLRQIIIITVISASLTLMLGIAGEVVHHAFQPWTSDYRFGGVMHPNAMAANCSMLLIALLALMNQYPSKKVYWVPMAIVTTLFLVLTKSRTACGAGLAGAVIFCVLVWPKPKTITTALTTAAVFSTLLAIFSSDMLSRLPDVMLMGRGQESGAGTLSNRIPLWSECLEYIARKPLTGYGYQTFWTPQRTIVVSAHQGWVVPHSHNQFIELALWIGVIGSCAYAIVMVGSIVSAYHRAKATRDSSWAFITAMMAYWTLNMLLEAMGLFPTLTSFVSLMLIARTIFPKRSEATASEGAGVRVRAHPYVTSPGAVWLQSKR